MKLLVLLPLLLSTNISIAQIDSAKLRAFWDWKDEVFKVETVNPKGALNLYLERENEFRSGKFSDPIAQRFYGEFATYYRRQGLYEEGLRILEEIEQNSTTDYFDYLFAYAEIYVDSKNFPNAISYYNKIVDRAILVHDTVDITSAYLGLSDIGLQLKKPKDVFLELAKMTPFMTDSYKEAISTYHHNMGVAYMLEGDFDLADVHLTKSLKLDIRHQESSSYDLPYDYLEIGILTEKKNDLKTALLKYDSALYYTDESTPMDLKLKIYRSIYSICDRLNEYKKGFESSLKYTALSDSIFSVERVQNLGRLELQTMIRDREKQEQDDLNRRRLIQYSAVFFVILLVVILTFYVRRFNVSPKVLGSVVFITILLFFEFVLVVLEPFLNKFTGNTPIYILLGNFAVALLFIPIHRTIENWFEKKVLHTQAPATVDVNSEQK